MVMDFVLAEERQKVRLRERNRNSHFLAENCQTKHAMEQHLFFVPIWVKMRSTYLWLHYH